MCIFESLKEDRKRNLAKLKRLLKKGVVEFEYKKIDGSLRKATGTLKKSLIPDEYKDDERIEKSNSDEVFTYYDIKKEDFRSFRKDNFRKILHQNN